MTHQKLAWILITSTAAGCGGVHTAAEAPFDLHPKVSLFSPASTGDDASGGALLFLGDGDLDCNMLAGKSYEDAIQAVIAKGTGAGFWLDAYALQGSAVGDLTGLWTEAGAEAVEEPYAQYRSLLAFGWQDGFVSSISSDETGWLQLDEVGDKVTGAFRTSWWWGDFRAEACAAYDDAPPATTTTSTYTF
ncbi:MAG: hypothetical protein R3F59_02805 [Myxococcota bacterium]